MKKTLIFVVVALIIGLSFIIVAKILSNTAIDIKNKGYVRVKGFAKQEIKSDLAIFEAKIVEEDADLKLCYKNLTTSKDKVKNFLKTFGIPDNSIEFYSANIDEEYKINERGYSTDEFVKYILKQNFKIESNDVEQISKLAEEISQLLDDGVKMFVSDPKYVYTKLDDLKVEMIGRATANAKERAKTIAEKGNFRLGPIASVRVGIFQITPLHSTKVSNYGINDTSSIDKEIKSVVEIKYFVR